MLKRKCNHQHVTDQHGCKCIAGCHVSTSASQHVYMLMIAIILGYVDIFMILLESGANVDAAEEVGQTPLMKAIIHDNIEIFKILLKHGADVNIADSSGRTAIDHAWMEGKDGFAFIMLKLDLVETSALKGFLAFTEEEEERDLVREEKKKILFVMGVHLPALIESSDEYSDSDLDDDEEVLINALGYL